MSFLKSPLFKFDILLHFRHSKFDEPSLEDFSQTTPKKTATNQLFDPNKKPSNLNSTRITTPHLKETKQT